MLRTAKARVAVLGLVLGAGVALLGVSVRGVATVDGQLRDAATSAPVHVEDDCPWKDRQRQVDPDRDGDVRT